MKNINFYILALISLLSACGNDVVHEPTSTQNSPYNAMNNTAPEKDAIASSTPTPPKPPEIIEISTKKVVIQLTNKFTYPMLKNLDPNKAAAWSMHDDNTTITINKIKVENDAGKPVKYPVYVCLGSILLQAYEMDNLQNTIKKFLLEETKLYKNHYNITYSHEREAPLQHIIVAHSIDEHLSEKIKHSKNKERELKATEEGLTKLKENNKIEGFDILTSSREVIAKYKELTTQGKRVGVILVMTWSNNGYKTPKNKK